MASYDVTNDIVGGGYGLGGFGGGAWAMIILVVVVLWLLFKDGHRDGFDGRGHGFEGFGGCGPCVRPSFLDELKVSSLCPVMA